VAPSRIRRDPRRRDPRAAAAPAESEPPPPPPSAPAEPVDPLITLINAKFITPSKIATLLLGGQLQVEMLKNVPEQMQKEIILEVEKQKAESAIKKEELPPPPPPLEPSEPLPPSEPELSVAEVDMVDPNSDEWIEMGQDAVRRIVELEPLFSWSASTIPSAGNANNSNAASEKQEQFLLAQQSQILNPVDEKERLVSARSGWMLLVSRLVSKAVDETDDLGIDEDRSDSGAKGVRKFLLEYILEDFRSRYRRNNHLIFKFYA
jgi:hypothetical protein